MSADAEAGMAGVRVGEQGLLRHVSPNTKNIHFMPMSADIVDASQKAHITTETTTCIVFTFMPKNLTAASLLTSIRRVGLTEIIMKNLAKATIWPVPRVT